MYANTNTLGKHTNDYFIKRSILSKKRRTAQLRRRYLFVAIIIITLLLLSGAFGSFIAKAQSPDTESNFKYYTHITVSYGESLWTIADRYMSDDYNNKEAYIQEVVRINSLDDENDLYAGTTIVVPYYSSEFK